MNKWLRKGKKVSREGGKLLQLPRQEIQWLGLGEPVKMREVCGFSTLKGNTNSVSGLNIVEQEKETERGTQGYSQQHSSLG